jgi:PelA/Pel-15E family pectate lyase
MYTPGMRPTRRQFLATLAASTTLVSFPAITRSADASLAADARRALDRATAFYRSIATHGGYLWSYSTDLKDRRGETKATESQIWVQPPGTPAIGQLFLRCHDVTKDPTHLEAARAAADALAYGQLDSGGWHYMIDFDPNTDPYLRRALAPAPKSKKKNVTTFDDNNTQSAIRFLLSVTRVTDSPDNAERAKRLTDALDYALAGMLRAQYPNGAFPQGYNAAPRNPADYPAIKAKFPKDWHDLPKIKDYWYHYTLNDHAHGDCLETLLEVHRVTKKPEFLDAAKKAGDFLLLAQLPEPQPAWAQQYTPDMFPAWARKFEPPAVCSSESVGVCRTLVDLYLATGDGKYLAPLPAAFAWLKKVTLPDGRHARFYELNTDKPLYMTKDYQVTYKDDDLPTHYGFKTTPPLAAVEKYYNDVKSAGREAWLKSHAQPHRPTPNEAAVREAIRSLDDQGRWIDQDRRITGKLFIRNTSLLCDYLAAAAAG